MDCVKTQAAKNIKNAKFLEYTDAPHGLFATHKDKLTKDLIDFLKQ